MKNLFSLVSKIIITFNNVQEVSFSFQHLFFSCFCRESGQGFLFRLRCLDLADEICELWPGQITDASRGGEFIITICPCLHSFSELDIVGHEADVASSISPLHGVAVITISHNPRKLVREMQYSLSCSCNDFQLLHELRGCCRLGQIRLQVAHNNIWPTGVHNLFCLDKMLWRDGFV